MMLRRFKLYTIGVILGSIVLIFIFQQKKNISWLPKDKLRENLEKYPLTVSEYSSCQLTCIGIDKEALKASFAEAEIDFGKSEAQKEPCPVYHVEVNMMEKGKYNAFVEMCDSTNALVSISAVAGENCQCE